MPLNPVENECLDHVRLAASAASSLSSHDWLAFGLVTEIDVCRWLRVARRDMTRTALFRKADGTPTTPVEKEVEERVRARLSAFDPDAGLLGEETGGELLVSGMTVAVDPVDGTWAFLNGTESFSSTLAVFEDGRPRLGFVASPSTGEIAYGGAGIDSRLIRLSIFGEGDEGWHLPLTAEDGRAILVNVHPSRAAPSVVEALYRAWSSSDIRALRSPGGSPALGIVEAAKGTYTYVNLWTRRGAEPFDLTAPVLVMRGAGGEVVDIHGDPVDAARHAGPFVAALDAGHRECVARVVRDALRTEEDEKAG